MRYQFDTDKFSKKLKTRRVIDLNVGLREVAKKSKVSPATLSRMERGGTMEMDSFLRICNWLQASPHEFIVATKSKTK